MAFYPGQKVVCVDDAGMDRILLCLVSALPVKGRVYTVRGIVPPTPFDDGYGLLLDEITGNIHPGSGFEFSFRVERFRPVTDIGFAHEILRKATKRHKADA